MFPTDRNSFLLEMKALLSFMDTEDRERALRHYEIQFDRVGETGEDALIESYVSPLRQVLQLERRYRERQEAGLPLFDEEEEGSAVEEAYEEAAFEEVGAYPPPEAETPEALPVAGEPETEADLPVPPAESALSVEGVDAAEEAAPNATEDFDGDAAQAPYDELPPQLLSDAAGEMLSQIDFGEQPEEEQPRREAPPVEWEAEPREADGEKKPSAGRVAAAVLLSPLMILLAAAGVVLTFALAAIPLALCALFAVVSLYLALYAVTSMPYLPDMLLVLGLAVGLLAFTVLFLWAAIAVLVGGIGKTTRLLAALYGRVLGKGGN